MTELTIHEIELGSQYMDKVTGYIGRATEKTECLYGSSTVKLESYGTGQAESKTFFVGRLILASKKE